MTRKERKRVEQRGYDDYFSGIVVNPYKFNSERFRSWLRGWAMAETHDYWDVLSN